MENTQPFQMSSPAVFSSIISIVSPHWMAFGLRMQQSVCVIPELTYIIYLDSFIEAKQ